MSEQGRDQSEEIARMLPGEQAQDRSGGRDGKLRKGVSPPHHQQEAWRKMCGGRAWRWERVTCIQASSRDSSPPRWLAC